MPSIVLRLDPAQLEHPDADLRYLIPEALEAQSRGNVREDGYDYEDGSGVMQIYFEVADLEAGLAAVVRFVETDRLLGNDFSKAAQIGTSALSGSETQAWAIAYPPAMTGTITCPTGGKAPSG